MSKMITDPDGTKRWFFNEKLHRVDGPAIEWKNGDKEWWFDGIAAAEFYRIDAYLIDPRVPWSPDNDSEIKRIWWEPDDVEEILNFCIE